MSPQQMIVDFQDWLVALPPAFLFLLALPFVIAIAALAQEALRARAEPRAGAYTFKSKLERYGVPAGVGTALAAALMAAD